MHNMYYFEPIHFIHDEIREWDLNEPFLATVYDYWLDTGIWVLR